MMQRGSGGRFAFVGRQGTLGAVVGRHAAAASPSSASALSLRNRDIGAASSSAAAAYATRAPTQPGKERQWYEWSKIRSTSSKHDPFYEHVSTEARYGMSDVWTQGMDPPQPIFPIDVKGRSKAYLPEVLSRKHNFMKYAMLNRPQQLNALNIATIRQLTPVLKKWQAHKETTSAIVLASSTPDNFCSGTDFIDLLQAVKSGNHEYPKTYFKELYQLVYYISSLDKPFLPVMNGVAMGAGASIAYNSSSFKVATEDTIFALPETSMGFFPDAGASYLLPRLPDHVGTFLALTGKRIRGWDVLWSGIATNLVPVDRVHILYEQLDQLRNKFHTFEQIIQCVHSCEANKNEHPYLLKEKGYLDIIKRCFSKPTVPEIMKALSHEKHPWAQQVLARLQEQCPLSLAVTLRNLQEGATKDLGAALRRDYRIALRFMLSRDFAEGITARVVENRKPEWSHKSVNDIHPDEIQAFFASLHEDELVIKSLDEEREETSAVQQLLEKQRRIKKLLRRPWVQEEIKRYLNDELESLQQELKGGKENDAVQSAGARKVIDELSHKGEAVRYLQILEDELIRRRDTEKHAVNRTTVDKLEWKRWEEDIHNVREAKGVLALDVSPDNEEQLPTALLQGVLINNLRGSWDGSEDLSKQANLVASALDTAGKSANELREAIAKQRNERVAETEAEYEQQYKRAMAQDAFENALMEGINEADPEDVKRLIAEDMKLSPEERPELDIVFPSSSGGTGHLRRRREREQERKQYEMEAKPLITLDDIARLILGGEPDDAQVANMRTQVEKGEISVSEDIYAAAGQLMRERALAEANPEERSTVQATLDALTDEMINVIKAKVAGKSRKETVEELFNSSTMAKMSTLFNNLEGLSQNQQAFISDSYNQAVFIGEIKKFAQNIDSHISDGVVPLWKLNDNIIEALTQQELEAIWPKEKRDELKELLQQDRQLTDAHKLNSLAEQTTPNPNNAETDAADQTEATNASGEADAVDAVDAADATSEAYSADQIDEDEDDDDDDDELGEDEDKEILTQIQNEVYHGKSSYYAPDQFMSERAKDMFEREQADMGIGRYGTQFEYKKYSDRIAHFQRIKQRQEEFLNKVPDPVSQPKAYREWLISVRMAELTAPHIAEVFEAWLERRANSGYNVRPVPQMLRDDTGPMSSPAALEEDLSRVPPTISALWDATKETLAEESGYPDSMPRLNKEEDVDEEDDNDEEEAEPGLLLAEEEQGGQQESGADSTELASSDELLQAIKNMAGSPSSSTPSS